MKYLNLDLLCVCETFLKNKDQPYIQNYIWFGLNLSAKKPYLQNTNLCILNGRLNSCNNRENNFTSISTKGSAVVDYCLVPTEYIDSYSNFKVITLNDVTHLAQLDEASKLVSSYGT